MSKTQVELAAAREAAQELIQLLAPACARLELAGSIRRARPQVGDIELVAIPQVAVVQYGLFGEPGGAVSLLTAKLHELKERFEIGEFMKNGPRFKQFWFRVLPVDLFITTPAQWGVNFTIRTGSAEFSHFLVTPRKYGGALPGHLRVRNARVWHKDTALETPEETDVFAWVGLEWLAPAQREPGQNWAHYLRRGGGEHHAEG